MAGDKTIIRTTCPRDCYDSCGIAVIKRRGVITKVMGDPDHPVARGALCGKCALAYNGVWRDAAQRLQRPLKRIGPKGEGRFAAVSWDEALGEISAPPAAHRRGERAGGHLAYPLHRHLLPHRRRLSRPLLQPPRRQRDRARQHLQSRRPCGARSRLRQLLHRLRSARRARRRLHPGLGRQPFGLGPPCP